MNADQTSKPPLAGIRKAAVFLASIGAETSATILKRLTDEEVQLLTHEIAQMTEVDQHDTCAVLEEYERQHLGHSYIAAGGPEYARAVLQNAFGSEEGKRIFERVVKINNDTTAFDSLQRADPQQLAKLIHNEHPQTIALVLSHLLPSHAAQVLAALPGSPVKAEVCRRMAALDRISPELLSKVAAGINLKLRTLGDVGQQAYGGIRAVSEMMNRLDTSSSEELLADVNNGDPELAELIRQLMFVFEDFQKIDDGAMKVLVGALDRKVMALGLKGCSGQLRNHFMKCLSSRAVEMMKEDIAALGPVRLRDVTAAQHQIIATAKRLETEGTLSLKPGVDSLIQ
jgi:flagellar motor switch protein FliG